MKRTMGPALAAASMVLASSSAAAQDEGPTSPSQDAAWHNAQILALVSRQASDGWGWLQGGVLWRRVGGEGVGERPTVDDVVTLHYTGTFIDGTEFDSSRRGGRPATFPLRSLIRAWQLAVPMMAVGDTIEIAVPASMGYGPVGGGPIPGGATLLFEIELLGIQER